MKFTPIKGTLAVFTCAAVLTAALVLLSSCGAAEALGASGGALKSAPMERETAAEEPAGPVAASEMEAPYDEALAAPGEGADSAASAGTGTAVPAARERKRVYSGYAELLVDSIEKEKMRITGIAEDSGGYVEQMLDDTVTIRVPAARFSVIFAEIKGLGDLLDSYEETLDVTELYADLQARLTIAAETRDRLYRLLERTDDVEERIQILREIRRLSEEIERINLTFEAVKEHIAFSRITVRLISRLNYETASGDTVPFPWIDELHPLYPPAGRFGGSVRGELPDTFAVFKKDKYYHAETADGVRLRISTIGNKPRGDAGFWQKAMEHHLAPRFAETEARELGEVKGVLLTSKDPEPFYYFVGVKPDRRKLHVLEIFFPGGEMFEKHFPRVSEAVEELTIR